MLNWITQLILNQKEISYFNFLLAHSILTILFLWMVSVAFLGIFSVINKNIIYIRDKVIVSQISYKKFIYGISLSHLMFSFIIVLFISIGMKFKAYPSISEYENFPFLSYFIYLYEFSAHIAIFLSIIIIIILHNNTINIGLKLPKFKSLLVTSLIMLALYVIYTYLSYSDDNLNHDIVFESMEKIFWYTNTEEIIVIFSILESIILVPISEEIFFRSLIFQFFKQNLGIINGLILSSLFFAVIHIGAGIAFFLITFFAGLIFGLMFHITKSIYVPIIIHSSWNAFVVLNIISEANRLHFGG